MPDALFEKVNNPIGSYPYICVMSRNLNYISHYHESLEIIYVKSGTISAFCGAKELILKKDDICFFMPGEIHGFKSLEDNDLYILKVGLNSYIEEIDFSKLRLKENVVKADDENNIIFRNLILEMVNEHMHEELGYEFAVRHYKNKLIMEILRNLKFEFIDTGKEIKLMSDINKFLEENYARRIELDEIAARCHFSKYYFAHKLKEMTGMTFVEYLTAFRLEKAVRFLKNTDMSITEIAAESGFGSLRSFNRTFASVYKMTPTDFKKIP